MGKVLSVSSKVSRRFNVENRAEKVISRDKPVPAPKHPTSQREMDMIKKEYGDAQIELSKKNPTLDDHLKHVYVTSTSINMSKFSKPSDQSKLPLNRSSTEESEFGYEEPTIVPIGKVTLKEALKVLTNRKAAPEEITLEKISQSLNIKEQDAVNLVNYFSSFNLYYPEKTPQLSTAQKIKKIILTNAKQPEAPAVQATPDRARLEQSTSKKPD